MQGLRRLRPLPSQAPEEYGQGVQGRQHLARTSAGKARARSAEAARSSARTSARRASARSAEAPACRHQRRKDRCKECGGGKGLCPHQRQKSKCKECAPSGPAEGEGALRLAPPQGDGAPAVGAQHAGAPGLPAAPSAARLDAPLRVSPVSPGVENVCVCVLRVCVCVCVWTWPPSSRRSVQETPPPAPCSTKTRRVRPRASSRIPRTSRPTTTPPSLPAPCTTQARQGRPRHPAPQGWMRPHPPPATHRARDPCNVTSTISVRRYCAGRDALRLDAITVHTFPDILPPCRVVPSPGERRARPFARPSW